MRLSLKAAAPPCPSPRLENFPADFRSGRKLRARCRGPRGLAFALRQDPARPSSAVPVAAARPASASAGVRAVPPIVLLGVPGAGKGTQAKRIIARYGIPHISTGEMFRRSLEAGSPLGLEARAYMEKGQLVPDDLVCQVVAERLRRDDCAHGYILDGFPRTLAQAHWLYDFLESRGPGPGRSLIVIYLSVGYNELYRRLTGRRYCPVCARIYNIYTQPARRPGFCDVDGAPLDQRPDDEPDVVRERMVTYEEQTMPLLAELRRRGNFFELPGTDPVDRISGRIFEILDARQAWA